MMRNANRQRAIPAGRGTLSLGMVILLWAIPGLCLPVGSASQAGPAPQATVRIDAQALKLLAQVQRRMSSLRTLSAVSTHTQRRLKGASPTQTAAFVLKSQVCLMRPNLTRIETALLSRKTGEKVWNSTPHFRTEACDGRRAWTVFHNEHTFDTGQAPRDGRSLRLYNLDTLNGFFDSAEFVTHRIDLLRQEGLVRSLILVAPGHPSVSASQLIRLVYQRVGSEILATEEYSIGVDLLIHRLRLTSGAGEVETTIDLSQIRVDAPMTKSSFAFHTPPGTKPRRIVPDTSEAPLPTKGTEAPDFTVQDAQGNLWKLSDLRGKWVVLDFWATWCGNCVEAFPGLNAFAERRKAQNVVVLAISVGDTKQVFQNWLSKHKQFGALHFALEPEGIDGNGFDTKLYHVYAYPTQFVIDPTGKIQASFVGYDNDSEKRLAAAVPQP
jgi:peroxiredoxin/outer membrane lipoprotein-sorting protein